MINLTDKKILGLANLYPVETYTINVANLSYYSSYRKLFKMAVRGFTKIFFFDKSHREKIISISTKK